MMMTKLVSILLAAAVAGCSSQSLPFPVESFDTPTGNKVEIAMIVPVLFKYFIASYIKLFNKFNL